MLPGMGMAIMALSVGPNAKAAAGICHCERSEAISRAQRTDSA
jgi:hypothetical protein